MTGLTSLPVFCPTETSSSERESSCFSWPGLRRLDMLMPGPHMVRPWAAEMVSQMKVYVTRASQGEPEFTAGS